MSTDLKVKHGVGHLLLVVDACAWPPRPPAIGVPRLPLIDAHLAPGVVLLTQRPRNAAVCIDVEL